ncbi:DNA-directed RNA polymerase subunit beta, partial [Patescibacteria group bacterium]|nr:DNA-directed RNA polymerase subunit beta [Patescibacteria group bacterium]
MVETKKRKEEKALDNYLAPRKYFQKKEEAVPLPNLIEAQRTSYDWFIKDGLKELFKELGPIISYNKDLELELRDYYLDEAKYDEATSIEKNVSFEAPLRVKARLANKKNNTVKEQECYFGEFPLMTENGTFIINGIERVIVNQLIKSPGIFFHISGEKEDQRFFGAKIIPNRGAWLEIDTDSSGAIYARIDRKRKVAVTSLLRAFGRGSNAEILNLFKDADTGKIKFIEETLKRDIAKNNQEGIIEIYRRIRPGDLATVDNARQLVEGMFFNFERYDLGAVGRYKTNQRLGINLPTDPKHRVFQVSDLVKTIKEVILLNNNFQSQPDDIDHLGNRRVRGAGELIQERFRLGLARMERNIKDRMTTVDISSVSPVQLVNSRPLVAVLREFFASSQLSQFMDQVNPLAELEHKRRLSAMGPGGLTREHAGFEVRDVHPSHYGRICPIQTPEGPNIGLVGYLACQSVINDFGFLETPYRKVTKGKVTDEIVYFDATEEEKFNIAPAGLPLDEQSRFIEEKVEARIKGNPGLIEKEKIDYMDVSPQQAISVSTAMIPFLEHNDAQRVLMGSNMQRQAVSCIRPESAIIGTGIEKRVAVDSGAVIVAERGGKVAEVDANHIVIENAKKKTKDIFKIKKFIRSNAATCINQTVRVEKGQMVSAGELLADGAATEKGEIALGQNLTVAFMSWGGANFEDAIIISERLVKDDRFTSIHIEDFSIEVRDTKLGPEIITRDIPNVGEEKLKDLDEEGIIRIGAEVKPGDILVGKITPKGESELTAEERLLRS